jgi:hypothetical protein
LVGLILTACGGGSDPNFGPETDPTPAQKSAISSTAQDLALISMADAQGQAAGGAAIGFAFEAAELLLPTGGATARALPDAAKIAPAISAIRQAQLIDCEVVSPTSIVWNHCTDSSSGFTIDGMMSWGPGHVDVDLHISGNEQGTQITVSLKGSVTVSPSSIKGDLTISANLSGGGNSASQTLRTQIDVELANGCVSSGTLTVTASGSGQGSVNAAVQVIWTGCNMFRVRNG